MYAISDNVAKILPLDSQRTKCLYRIYFFQYLKIEPLLLQRFITTRRLKIELAVLKIFLFVKMTIFTRICCIRWINQYKK